MSANFLGKLAQRWAEEATKFGDKNAEPIKASLKTLLMKSPLAL
jgi:hypothetical protein